MARKLGLPTSQRKAMLRNQVSNLLWNGKIETTLPVAKEVRSYAEKLITLAKKGNFEGATVEVTKKVKDKDKKGNVITIEKQCINDSPKKLAIRRRLMSELYDLKEIQGRNENDGVYRERTRDVNHPLIEKMFNELAPKYADRNGGYTRVLKLGPRRGDAAEMAIIELV